MVVDKMANVNITPMVSSNFRTPTPLGLSPRPPTVDQLISPPGYGSQVADKCIDTAFTLSFCKQAYRSLY